MNYTATDTYGYCARETSNVCTLRAFVRVPGNFTRARNVVEKFLVNERQQI